MEQKKNTALQIFKFDQIQLPRPTENPRIDWINFGEDNLFPQYLQELLGYSAIHSGIIDSKVNFIIGNGFTYDKKSDRKTDAFIQTANPNESLLDVFYKCVFDYLVYGGFCLDLIWGKGRKYISEVYHKDFGDVRCGKMTDGIVTNYYVAEDWYKVNNYNRKEKTITYQAFDPSGKGDPEQLMYTYMYKPGRKYYPLPSYIGAIDWIEIDKKISNYHLSHLNNGMFPNCIVSFATEEPEEDVIKVLKKQFRDNSGTDAAGKFILLFGNPSPNITNLQQNDMDKQFIQLQSSVVSNLLIAHKATNPELFAVQVPGSLGSSNTFQDAFKIFLKVAIEPVQKFVLDKFNYIAEINGLQELKIEQNYPIESGFTEGVLTSISTIDELRKEIGMVPLAEALKEGGEGAFIPGIIAPIQETPTTIPTSTEPIGAPVNTTQNN